ncbi:MAG: PepSY domain-containing protein [Anaerorhabdus sp.]
MKKYLISLAVLFLLVGCSSFDDDHDDKDDQNEKVIIDNVQENTNEIDMEKAKEIALKDQKGEIVKEFTFSSNSVSHFEIDIVSDNYKYEYTIDNQGNITSKEKEIIDETLNQDKFITSQAAQDIMIEHAGGGTIISCELDIEYNEIYEIEMVLDNQEYDGVVDAVTGEVIKFNKDY